MLCSGRYIIFNNITCIVAYYTLLYTMYHKPKKFIFSNWRKENKYLPEDGQELIETCRRIIKTFKQYDYFNVLFLIK